jgi:hypothetical protein
MRTVFALVTGAVLGTTAALWLAARRAAHEPPAPPTPREVLAPATETAVEQASDMMEAVEAAAEEASA